MKNYFLKVVFLTTILCCITNLNAQKKIKIGDEFDVNIKINKKKYTQFKKTSLDGQKKLVFQKEFYS